MRPSRLIVAAITLASGALIGCSVTSPFESPWTDTFTSSEGFDTSDRRPFEQLAQAFPRQGIVTPHGSQAAVPSSRTDEESSWWVSLRKMGATLGEAFTITPKTIPAPDPTSLANRPGDVGGDLNYHAARVYETEGNIAGAISLYQKSLTMTPNDVRVMISYARLLDREGSFREAERLYHRAIELEPDNVVALNDLGMVYARQGLFEAALESLHQAIQLQPTNPRYRNNMAIVLVDAARPDEAFIHLVSAHGEAGAHYNLGYLLARRGMNDQAVAHLQQALTMNPQLAAARELLGRMAIPARTAHGMGVSTMRIANPEPSEWLPPRQHGPQRTSPRL